jgi:hypothetical protein
MADIKKISNELNRLYFETIDNTKNNVVQVLANAVANGTLKIERDALPKLLAVITNTIDGNKIQMHKGYERNVKKLIDELTTTSKTTIKTK